MNENALRLTNRELFYTAMMLHLDQLVNVDYIYPFEENELRQELNDAKKTLRKKKLLKENAKGEVSMDASLAACASICAKPEECVIKKSGEYYATLYGAGGAYMLLEREPEEQLAALWFQDRASADTYLAGKIGSAENDDGGNE